MTWAGVVVVYPDDVIEIDADQPTDCVSRLAHPACDEIPDGWIEMIVVTETNDTREEETHD